MSSAPVLGLESACAASVPDSSEVSSDASSVCWHSAVVRGSEQGRHPGEFGKTYGLDDVPADIILGNNGGCLRYHHNSQGLRICSYWYPAIGKARGTIVCMHGNGVYFSFAFLNFQGPGLPSSYADSWIEALNLRGFSVCGIDMQSCGRSEGLYGLRMYLESWEDAVRDQLQFIEMVRTCESPSFGGLPMFLLGASMGGCIATHCAHALQNEPWFKGAILLAGMLAISESASMSLVLELVARTFAAVAPTAAIFATNSQIMKERIPNLFEGYHQDPGVYKGPTRAKVAWEYIEAVKALQLNTPAMTFPVLAVHSPDDTLTNMVGSLQLIENSASLDKKFHAAPGMWHDLVQEDGGGDVLQAVLEWLEARAD